MIEDYIETRVVMSPNGELLLALPIYADQSRVVMTADEVESITGVTRLSFGTYENFGYLMYTPKSDFAFYLAGIDLFEDLGLL